MDSPKHHALHPQLVDIADLVLDPDNAREHDQRNLDTIAASLREYGQRKAIVVNRVPLEDGEHWVVEAGNGTVEAAKSLGWAQVVAVFVEDDEATAAAYAITDNHTSELSGWKPDQLAATLSDHADAIDWGDLGWADGDVDALLGISKLPPVESVPINSLTPHPDNYRIHHDDQVKMICDSIEANGFYRTVVVTTCGVILAGHASILAARRCGLTHVRACRLPIDPTGPEALRMLASDNEISGRGELLDRKLVDVLSVVEDSLGLEGTGFDSMMLAAFRFTAAPAEGVSKDFEAADSEWEGKGMPAFEREPKRPTLVVTFETERQRETFLRQHWGDSTRVKVTAKTAWSAWWPPEDKSDPSSVRFVDSGKAKR